MAMRRNASAALALILALAACSSDRGGPGPRNALSQVTGAVVAQLRPETGGEITASDAEINALPVNVLLVENETTGSRAGFAFEAANGDALAWRSNDGIAIVTRGGQLSGTAGFGFDLSSAALPPFRPGGTVTRTHYRLRGDTEVRPETFTCTQSAARPESVTVTGRRFETRRITESCRSAERTGVENRYWIDAAGWVRKSRQWASPQIGYLVIEDVHGGLR